MNARAPTILFMLPVMMLGGTATVPAATRTKANNNDALNLASSWTNAIVPIGADVAQFDATITVPLTLTLGADTAWSQINFVNPGGEITLSSGSTLTLSNNTPIIFGTGALNRDQPAESRRTSTFLPYG